MPCVFGMLLDAAVCVKPARIEPDLCPPCWCGSADRCLHTFTAQPADSACPLWRKPSPHYIGRTSIFGKKSTGFRARFLPATTSSSRSRVRNICSPACSYLNAVGGRPYPGIAAAVRCRLRDVCHPLLVVLQLQPCAGSPQARIFTSLCCCVAVLLLSTRAILQLRSP